MALRNVTNVPASFRQQLLNLSRRTGEPFDLILTRYGLERLLYRLGHSQWRHEFILKGAMLFALWHGTPTRPTRDIDLLDLGPADPQRLTQVFQDLCKVETDDDGLLFEADSVRVNEIRENNIYQGLRVKLQATLAGARIPLQVDVGFGDVVFPDPVNVEYPTLLDLPPPLLRAYPVYTVIAEKLEAVVTLGMANTRMKDFYDLWMFSEQVNIDGRTLVQAIRATFERRQTALPGKLPVGLTAEFFNDSDKALQWEAFLRRNRLGPGEISLGRLTRRLGDWLAEPLSVAMAQAAPSEFDKTWPPGGPWKKRAQSPSGKRV